MKLISFYSLLVLLMSFNTHLNAQCTDNTCECIYSLALQEDTLWIGTKVGLFKYNTQNGDKQLYDKTNSPLPNNFVNGIKIDADQSLWIGTYGGGLAHLKENQWTIFNKSNSQLVSNNIFFGIEVFKDTLWIGTDKGVAAYDGNAFGIYNQDNSILPSAVVFSLANEGDSIMWIAVRGGLYKYNGDWASYTRENSGLPHNLVYDVTVKGELKYVSTEQGIVCLDDFGPTTTWMPVSDDKTLVLKYNPKRNAEYWAGTINGLKKYFFDRIEATYNTSNSIMTNNYVQALAVDDSDTKWIGTWGGGVYKLTASGNFTKLDLNITSGINENIITSNLSIYPNPIEDFVEINYTEFPLETLQKVEIYNLNGQLLKSKMNETSEKLIRVGTSDLTSGIYLLEIHFTEKTIVKKIIKK